MFHRYYVDLAGYPQDNFLFVTNLRAVEQMLMKNGELVERAEHVLEWLRGISCLPLPMLLFPGAENIDGDLYYCQ
jgi:hypothetical protein